MDYLVNSILCEPCQLSEEPKQIRNNPEITSS